MKKALVAVGVNETDSAEFRPLSAAAAGAKEVAAWGTSQGFDVTTLTDDDGPVTINAFFAAVKKYVDQNAYEQLVVYFSGHGLLLSPDAEVWLLSGALSTPNEVVNMSGSIAAARTCGVPHVVFISDACRSMPTNFRMGALYPGVVFPVRPPRAPSPEVDIFYATLPGDPALELPPAEAEQRYRGLLTSCLLKALKGTPPSLVEQVGEGAAARHVIACRPLKKHLVRAVPDAAAEVSIQLVQEPDVRVESELPKYLGELTSPAAPLDRDVMRSGKSLPLEHSKELPDRDVMRSGEPLLVGRKKLAAKRARTLDGMPRLAEPASESFRLTKAWGAWASTRNYENRDEKVEAPDVGDVRESIQRIVDAAGRTSFETSTGFSFQGLDVAYVRTTDTPQPPQLFVEAGVKHARVFVDEERDRQRKRAALIRLSDGSGFVLSVLTGYVATVVGDGSRVLTVNYTPSQNNGEAYDAYRYGANEIEQSRALVATLARHGSLRVDAAVADKTADFLRRYKRLDPTLGLFAAYAYAQSGNTREIVSVYRYMKLDRLPVLFDVAMLAAQAPSFPQGMERPRVLDFAPWLPMLTQGWLLLGEYQDLMPQPLRQAKQYLIPGLWTTFSKEGVDVLENAMFGRGTI